MNGGGKSRPVTQEPRTIWGRWMTQDSRDQFVVSNITLLRNSMTLSTNDGAYNTRLQ